MNYQLDILFKNHKLEKILNDHKKRIQHFGPIRAKMIGKRLDELKACDTLGVLSKLPPPRCHELTGVRSGTLSVDLDQPYRLIFEPADNPLPLRDDGGLEWNNVKTIRILEIVDPH